MTVTLETPQQLAHRVGVSVSSIRHLIKEMKLDHIYPTPGSRNVKIPFGAWERYLADNIVKAETASGSGRVIGVDAAEIRSTDARRKGAAKRYATT